MSSSASSVGAMTPATTPEAEQIDQYIILDVSRSRALTCHDGHLRLEAIDLHHPHRHVSEQTQWECNERGGFSGFKNIAEGTFLGHDIWWDFYAKV
ncbi:hypothetical protein FSHL1_001282 [Fusarium sambucinum]